MMRRRLPPLAALRAFEAAARHLSFRRAAAELGVTPTAISHQIRLLEATLGLPLFVREVRRVALTVTGRRLYPALRDGFDTFERGLADLSPRTGRKAVTLTATTLFTARRLLPALGAFRGRHPAFDLRLHASDDLVDLAAGLADIAVRYGSGPFAGLITEPLLSERFGVLCSPSLGLSVPEDLKQVPLLHVEWKRPDMAPDWRRWARLAGLSGLTVDAGPRLTDDGQALQAAVAGHGVVVASLVLAGPEIEAGLLVHPFGPVIAGETYHVAATPENMACADVRAVRDWLRALVCGP
ncbi:LysR substrate-binding domain-containing protein [Methylobacterium sp. E-005]|uniref:LysR substrate-binding domain-containing protein n=1 Tax=Methylobacterium sp. E-005 TaxID=2836549 RepID=UPI001FBB375B|nr:LysR substrate-binding domain-containing protein [Methylobacterium sp. E-005]MCJ2089874.1 LysR substrate-binding domain-containing protein [Methylobacterium sp. E-005]